MLHTLVAVALFACSVAADIAISSPEMHECQHVNITWQDTWNPPYNLLVVDPGNPCGTPYAEFDVHEPHLYYNVSRPAGTKVQLTVLDSVGDEGWSNVITIGPSSGSCGASQSSHSSSSSGTSSSGSASSGTTDGYNIQDAVPSSSSSTLVPSALGAIGNAQKNPTGGAVRGGGSAKIPQVFGLLLAAVFTLAL